MPPRKQYPTTMNKRYKQTPTTYKRRYPLYKAPTKISFGKQALPPQLTQTLKYVESVSITLTAGIGSYRFLANSLYDPNSSGAGHQPMYFDQFGAMYDHYVVLKSKIKGTHTYTGTMISCLYKDDDTSAASSITAAAEYDGAYVYINNGTTNKNPPLYQYYDAQKVYGGNPLSNNDLAGTPNSSPTEIQVFYFQFFDSSAPNTSFQLLVEMEFEVVWTEFATTGSS